MRYTLAIESNGVLSSKAKQALGRVAPTILQSFLRGQVNYVHVVVSFVVVVQTENTRGLVLNGKIYRPRLTSAQTQIEPNVSRKGVLTRS